MGHLRSPPLPRRIGRNERTIHDDEAAELVAATDQVLLARRSVVHVCACRRWVQTSRPVPVTNGRRWCAVSVLAMLWSEGTVAAMRGVN